MARGVGWHIVKTWSTFEKCWIILSSDVDEFQLTDLFWIIRLLLCVVFQDKWGTTKSIFHSMYPTIQKNKFLNKPIIYKNFSPEEYINLHYIVLLLYNWSWSFVRNEWECNIQSIIVFAHAYLFKNFLKKPFNEPFS